MSTNTATTGGGPVAVPPTQPVIPKPHPSASLYVGDLQPNVTEGMLFEIFSQIGPLASIRVCRDTLTRRSLGYAYVNFHTVIDAERALDTLNNHPIKGRPCRIMWSQRDPSVRKSGVGNIFIKNLDPVIGHKELYDTFSAFGNILSCKVAIDENGNSKSFGFVHFETAESAEKATDYVNDKLLGSKKVFVGKFQPKKERKKQKDSSWTNVYIKDLDPNVTEEDLVRIFADFGRITSCAVMRKDNASLGFGFVNFDTHESAQRAVEQLHQHTLYGKQIWCGRAQKKSERIAELQQKFKQLKIEQFNKFQGVNLYIKNIEDEIDEERLKKEFAGFGQIRCAKIMEDTSTHGSKGFGFICFTSADEAQNAINEMNGRILASCTKPLYVALHEPKDIRRQKLAQRHAPQRKVRPNTNVPVPTPVYPGGYYQPTGSPSFVYHQAQMPATRPATRPPWPAPQQGAPMQMHPTSGQYVQGRNPRGGRQQIPSARMGARVSAGRRPNQPGLPPYALESLSLAQLSTYPPDQQKLLLGERLYPLIEKYQGSLAGKITGMLLDSGWATEELFSLVDDEEKLLQKIEEAVTVLRRADSEAVTGGGAPEQTTEE